MWQDGLNATGKISACVCVYVQAWHSVHTGASFIVLFLFEEAHVSVCQRVCGQPVTCWRSLWEARPPPLLWNCQLVGHISDWSVTHALCRYSNGRKRACFLPWGRQKRQADKPIKTINQYFSWFPVSAIISLPLPRLHLSPSLPPPPLFLSSPLFVSSLPPSLSVHLNYSPPRHHPPSSHLPTQSPLTFSPSLPFLPFPPSLLKPVKGYWAPLSIRSNSISSLCLMRVFFFTTQMGLGCCCYCYCSKFF